MRDVNELNLPGETLQKQLHFQVANIVILNPTAKTIGIRVGNTDIPRDLNNVDLFVLPGSFVVYPVVGREFAFAFMAPQLAVQPSGMPTKAAIIFLDASEQVPAFGAIALTTFTEITNPDLTVVPGAPWPVLQSGDWNVDAVIQNATLSVTQSGLWTVNATIQNASIAVTQSGAWNANITNAVINVGQSGAWSVAQSGAWNVAANITNATIAVAQSGAWSVAANITNALLNVAQSGTWNVNANITNATLTVAGNMNATINAVNVNFPVVNATGTTIGVNAPPDVLIRTEPAHASGTWNVTVSMVNASSVAYKSVTLTRIHTNVSRVVISGNVTGVIYLDITDVAQFQYARNFTFDLYSGLDTSVTISTTAGTATVTASWALIGHYQYIKGSMDKYGAAYTSIIPPDNNAIPAMAVSASYATHATLTQRLSYACPANVVARVKGVYIGIEGVATAQNIQAMWEFQTTGGTRIHRLSDVRNVGASPSFQHTPCDIRMVPTDTLRGFTLNNDAAAHFYTLTAYIEEELL